MKLCSHASLFMRMNRNAVTWTGQSSSMSPPLEHVFPKHALKVIPEAVEWAGRARLVIPLSRSAQPETSIAHVNVVAAAAGLCSNRRWNYFDRCRVCSFLRFAASVSYKTPTCEQQARNSEPEPNLRFIIHSVCCVRDFWRTETGNAKIEPSQSSNQLETPNLKRRNCNSGATRIKTTAAVRLTGLL